ncbi:MAG: cupin domain-containing protein [Nitrosarchaeum sp.]|nr:cupin domain-containing protein [Nitrosarchaeum sp.]
MKNITLDFHGTKMTVKVTTFETNGMYSIIHFVHPPNVGPALHMHPRGPESFYIIKGDYQFLIGDKNINTKVGDTVTVPNGTTHKFNAGNNGGEFLVISPPDLENYFYEVSQLLLKGNVTWDAESTIAKKYGQIFLDNTNHWKSH